MSHSVHARSWSALVVRLAGAVLLTWLAVGVAPFAAQNPPPAVYWLDTGPERGPYNDQTLRHGHSSPTNAVAGSVFLSLPNYMVPQGLAVDAGEGKVYTGHRSLFTGAITIRKMNLDGSAVETLHVFQGGSYGQMEFNPADGKLYIFNGATFAKMNASSDAIAADGGLNIEEILFPPSFSVTRGDIDLVNGTLIVMNTNAPGNWPFYSVNFDGTGAQALGASCPPHTCYQGFAVDGRSQKIYYSRRGQGADPLGYVYSQNYDGSDNHVLYGPTGNNGYLNAVSLAIDFDNENLIMAVGREGFGGHLSRGALDGSLFEQTFYNAALDFAPNFVALGSVPTPAVIDTDGDGVPDDEDAFPNNPNESVDSDGDGVGNNGDAFPNNPNESVDSDGDGVGNNGDAFPNNPNESVDSDGDGVGNNGDAFPNDPNESVDSDGDGIGDNADEFDHSNTAPNVSVGTCTIRVANQRLPNGATFNDLLAAAATGARNHGAYVSAVTQLADAWKQAGLISGNDKGMITACAAKSK